MKTLISEYLKNSLMYKNYRYKLIEFEDGFCMGFLFNKNGDIFSTGILPLEIDIVFNHFEYAIKDKFIWKLKKNFVSFTLG